MPNRRTLLRSAAAAAALLLPGATHLRAQAHPSAVGPSEIRHIQSISPRSGPPGTTVSVSTLNLPYEAQIHVGIGAMREGFEILAQADQGRWGEIAVRVDVPETTSWERPVVFLAFNAVFAPIGMSDPFHVTNEDGLVRRSGEVVPDGGECRMFRDQDQNLYELTGSVAGLEPGERVWVEGVYFEDGPCSGGPTLGVASVER